MKYSIVVPIYNIERYIEYCIESILQQSYQDYEVLLIDDGSTDNSGRIIEKYRENKKVKVLHKANGGLSDARNFGIENATGQYVWFIDGDDFIKDDNKLLVIDKEIENNDILSFNYVRYIEDKEDYKVPRVPIMQSSSLTEMIRVNAFNTSSCNKIFRRELITKNNIRFPFGRHTEDTFFCAKTIKVANKIKYINLDAYAYRQRPNSITTNINVEKYIDIMELIRELCPEETSVDECNYLMYSFVAYQYVCTLPFVYRLKDEYLFEETKKLRYLLSYDLCWKVKIAHRASQIIGFRNTLKLLNGYIRVKK